MVEINVDISNDHFKFERPNIHSLFFFLMKVKREFATTDLQ